MANASPTSAFKSPIFEIRVGSPDTAERFYAHAHILSTSEVLKAEVEGQWKENQERKIEWPHWSVGGAERFLEWLYRGDYVCPYPVQNTKEMIGGKAKGGRKKKIDKLSLYKCLEEPPAECSALGDGLEWNAFGSGTTSSKKKRGTTARPIIPQARQKNLSPPLTRLQDLSWNGCHQLDKLTQAEEFDKWTGYQLWSTSELDYENTFMTHAELYVMAHQYMLHQLKNMAWQRLRSVLISIGKPAPGSPVIQNIATLAHYVYRETGGGPTMEESHEAAEEEPLRLLVSSFAALHFTTLKHPRMDELMRSQEEADRDFVVELMAKVSRQMTHFESKEAPAAAIAQAAVPEEEGHCDLWC
ncbi:MAG: hypothetical protein LQ341_006864 [Variospora aurantia]|nr:MAG: hypothetical protein LQ341_006864 [Variospora aurantia]